MSEKMPPGEEKAERDDAPKLPRHLSALIG
jgi:hypothetical protein